MLNLVHLDGVSILFTVHDLSVRGTIHHDRELSRITGWLGLRTACFLRSLIVISDTERSFRLDSSVEGRLGGDRARECDLNRLLHDTAVLDRTDRQRLAILESELLYDVLQVLHLLLTCLQADVLVLESFVRFAQVLQR